MNRATSGADRVVILLLGLVLVAGGTWAVIWAQGWLPSGWRQPEALSYTGLPSSLVDAPWWPWLLLLAGIALFVIGLAWLLRHFRSSAVRTLSLPGEPHGGNLVLDGAALGDAFAAALQDADRGVVGARGKLVDDHGTLVLDVTAGVRRDADLRDVGHLCDEIAAQARRATGRSDIACRIRLRVAPRAAPPVRVR